MATAEELLAAEGSNKILTIDSDLRTINIPAGFGVFGVESDDDVLRVHFRGPRYYHEVDLSTFKIRVNINNAKGGEDSYPVTDVVVDSDTDTITFSWLVGRFTAQYRGDIKFSLCFREIDGATGNVTREFNTTTATGKILEGLETGEHIAQEYPDVIGGILLRLESLEENGIPASTLDSTLSIKGKAADAKAVGDALTDQKLLVVTLDLNAETASHSSTEILEHLANGGSVLSKLTGDMEEYACLWSVMDGEVGFSYVNVSVSSTTQHIYTVRADKSVGVSELVMEPGSGGAGMTEEQAEQLESNTTAIAEIQNGVVSGNLAIESQKYTITLTMEDGSTETHILETDENNYPVKLTVNGAEIPWTVTGVN